MQVTPEMLAAAWRAWHSRHGGKLGPGVAFREAIEAAFEVLKPKPTPCAICGGEFDNDLLSDICRGCEANINEFGNP